MSLAHPNAPFLLTFFKRRWLRDTADLVHETLERGDETLAFDDVDLDNDLLELRRVGGVEALRGIAHEVLCATGPLPAGPGLEALAPELEGPAVEAFLRLLAINVAFRVRSDELLADLMTHVAGGAAPDSGSEESWRETGGEAVSAERSVRVARFSASKSSTPAAPPG